jgi:hypothetical protein
MMKRKVERIAERLVEKLIQWETVDTITLAESAEAEIYDPYFFLSLDVYYRGTIPDSDERLDLFSDEGIFESSRINKKDRFMIEELPVRIEYKDMARVEEILSGKEGEVWAYRQPGTYMFYRIEKGRVLHKKSDWLSGIQGQLKELPDAFWQFLQEATKNAMEHFLSDISAAVIQNDNFFFLISSAGFIKSLCSLLFLINRQFEPSGRRFFEVVRELPDLPENFRGRFESFLRQDPEFTPGRKREIAELLTKSVITMI